MLLFNKNFEFKSVQSDFYIFTSLIYIHKIVVSVYMFVWWAIGSETTGPILMRLSPFFLACYGPLLRLYFIFLSPLRGEVGGRDFFSNDRILMKPPPLDSSYLKTYKKCFFSTKTSNSKAYKVIFIFLHRLSIFIKLLCLFICLSDGL